MTSTERRRDGVDLVHYEATGGLASALARHADSVLETLSEGDRRIAERMFKRLTERGADQRAVRRPTTSSDIAGAAGASVADVRRVVRHFRDNGSFVTTSTDDDPVVDISHESLIRQWPTLRRWVDEEAASGDDFVNLAENAARWKQDQVGLLRNPELQLAENWWERARPNEAWAARYHPGFADAQTYLRRSSSAALRRKVGVVALVALLFVAALVMLFLWLNAEDAKRAADQALEQRNVAEVGQVIAEEERELALQDARSSAFTARSGEVRSEDPALALALAVEAIKATEDPRPEALAALVGASAAFGDLRFVPEHVGLDNEAQVTTLAFVPDSSLLAVGATDGLRVWDAATGDLQLSVPGGAGLIDVDVSPDGKLIAGAASDGTVSLWDVKTGELVDGLPHRIDGTDDGVAVTSVAFAPDSSMLVSGDDRGRVWRWDLATMTEEQVVLSTEGAVRAIAFHPDGEVLATGHQSGNVAIWTTDLEPSETPVLSVSADPSGRVLSLAFRPDGMLAAGYAGGLITVWDDPVGREDPGWPIHAHTDHVRGLAFGEVGSDLLIASSQDRTTRLFSVLRRTQIGQPLRSHGDWVTDVALSSDGTRLATGSRDTTVTSWTAAGTLVGAHTDAAGEPRFATSVEFNHDDSLLASGGFDGHVRIWDPETGAEEHDLPTGEGQQLFALTFSPTAPDRLIAAGRGALYWWTGGGELEAVVVEDASEAPVRAVAIDASGDLAASGGDDGVVRLWEVGARRPTGATATIPPVPDQAELNQVHSLTFAADGLLFIGDKAGRLWSWNHVDGADAIEVSPGADHFKGGSGANLRGLAVSPDGTLLASGSADKTIELWATADLAAQREPALEGHDGEVSAVAFSSSGNWLASSSNEGTVRIWWVGDGPRAVVEIVTDARCIGVGCLTLDAAFSRNGRWLATAEGDGEVRLWEGLDDADRACTIAAPFVTAAELAPELPSDYEPRGCELS